MFPRAGEIELGSFLVTKPFSRHERRYGQKPCSKNVIHLRIKSDALSGRKKARRGGLGAGSLTAVSPKRGRGVLLKTETDRPPEAPLKDPATVATMDGRFGNVQKTARDSIYEQNNENDRFGFFSVRYIDKQPNRRLIIRRREATIAEVMHARTSCYGNTGGHRDDAHGPNGPGRGHRRRDHRQ